MNSVPELTYLEIAVTEKCNLNCKACSHFSPLAHDEDKVTLDEFVKDIRRIKELFPVIHTLRLLGGEPLLNDDVYEMARITRTFYPDARIKIVTNGLLIPAAAEKNLIKMAENGIEFDISLYKPTLRIKSKIDQVCNTYGVKRKYTELIETFRVRFDPTGSNDGAVSFEECRIGRKCTYLFKGILSGCPAPNVIHLYNEQFGTEIDGGDDLIDIHNTALSAAEIYRKIKSELSVCRYCAEIEEIPWSQYRGEPVQEDWFVSGR